MVCVRQDVAARIVIVQTSLIISVSTTRASALLNQALTTAVSVIFCVKLKIITTHCTHIRYGRHGHKQTH